MADVKVTQLTDDDLRYMFSEHGRVCFENQALKGEVLRLQAIIASMSNAHAGNVVEAEVVTPPSEAPHESVAA